MYEIFAILLSPTYPSEAIVFWDEYILSFRNNSSHIQNSLKMVYKDECNVIQRYATLLFCS